MRVVYDDSQANLAVDIIDECMEDFKISLDYFLKYESGINRIQTDRLRKRINKRLEEYGFRIGNTVTHAHGIGNNCAYPVYFDTPDEIQECCTICINRGMYGEAWVYLKDYNNNKLGKSYELHHTGIREI